MLRHFLLGNAWGGGNKVNDTFFGGGQLLIDSFIDKHNVVAGEPSRKTEGQR